MKKTFLYLFALAVFIQCRKESEDCHYNITINNNSEGEINFSSGGVFLDSLVCGISDTKKIPPNKSYRYNYSLWDCLELILKDTYTLPLYIIDPTNYTIEAIPCEEFEERNTILRTYILTLEDLERLNYTINYPEDVSIGVD